MSYGRVEGEALAAMQAAWDDRESFTRAELGDVARYWEWVARDGELFGQGDAAGLTCASLDDCYPPVVVNGIELPVGNLILRADRVLFDECVDADVADRLSRGEWREIQ